MIGFLIPRSRGQVLCTEQRYRRRFLAEDQRQNAAAFLLVGTALAIAVPNDLRLILAGGSTALPVALGARLGILGTTSLAMLLLLIARRPRALDRAQVLWLLATVIIHATLTLAWIPAGRYLDAVVSLAVLISVFYFALRGPLWPRMIAASISTAALAVLVGRAAAERSSLAQNTAASLILCLILLGIFSARQLELKRRKQHEVERQQRAAQHGLTARLRELTDRVERAEAMSQARLEFLAAMSHEFRTPMSAVIGLSEQLLAARLDAAARAQVQTISDSAQALLILLNDILDFAKIDSRTLSLVPAPFDLHQLAKSVVDMLQPAAQARSVALSLALGPGVPHCIRGDAARLRQVLVNLIANAIQFTERGSARLQLTARALVPPEHELKVLVMDSGIGMTAEVIARLFRPFAQADAGLSQRSGGSGLGLAISRQIVQAMGGDIQVDSAPGRGSVFSFTLRLQATESEVPALLAASAAPPAPGARLPLTTLVVDDCQINREVARSKLCQLGHRVDVASDGPSALVAVTRKQYDVIFVDLQLPGMSGIETSRRIIKDLAGRYEPYLVALTGRVYAEDEVACRKAGIRDFIGKPIASPRLHEVLARVAAERAAQSATSGPTAALSSHWWEKLQQLKQRGDPEFVARLCQLFIADARKRLRKLAEAQARGDKDAVHKEAHRLRAASATLGASEMARLCGLLEDASRHGHVARLRVFIDALLAEFPKVERALARAAGEVRPNQEDGHGALA